jgi:DNA-binding protein H-NS
MFGELQSMSVEELWSLREQVDTILCCKMMEERDQLDRRLRQLKVGAVSSAQARRRYYSVRPKYCNPSRPSETWAGRGRQPRWLTDQLRTGKKLDDFRIQAS